MWAGTTKIYCDYKGKEKPCWRCEKRNFSPNQQYEANRGYFPSYKKADCETDSGSKEQSALITSVSL